MLIHCVRTTKHNLVRGLWQSTVSKCISKSGVFSKTVRFCPFFSHKNLEIFRNSHENPKSSSFRHHHRFPNYDSEEIPIIHTRKFEKKTNQISKLSLFRKTFLSLSLSQITGFFCFPTAMCYVLFFQN